MSKKRPKVHVGSFWPQFCSWGVPVLQYFATVC